MKGKACLALGIVTLLAAVGLKVIVHDGVAALHAVVIGLTLLAISDFTLSHPRLLAFSKSRE